MCSQADYAHLGADLDLEQLQQDGAQGEPIPYADTWAPFRCTFPSRTPECGRRAVAVDVMPDGARVPRCRIHDGRSARYAAGVMGATRVPTDTTP